MKKLKVTNGLFTLYVSLLFLGFFSKPAFAYLDPGTGSYVVQVLIGVVLAASVTIKVYWKKITNFFTKRG
jgi:hypothetical protein